MSFRFPRFLSLLFLAVIAPSVASASWWWPFGKDYNELPAAEQTERSLPLYEDAIELRAEGKTRFAARKFKRIWDKYSGSTYAADALYQYGQICYERKKWKDSFRAFSRLLAVYPDFPNFDQVVEYMFRIAIANAEGDNIRWLWIIPGRAWERAVGYFEALLAFAPYSDLAPLALMNVAQIHQYLGNTPEAVDALDRMINAYPNSVLADDAYLELGNTFAELSDGPLYDQGATREAMSYYEDFLVLYPRHEYVADGESGLTEMRNQYAASKLVLGKYYYRHRNGYVASEIFFNEAITIAPNSPAAAEAREYIANIDRFKEMARADPNFSPPKNRLIDYLIFWRSRPNDLTAAGAAEANAVEDAQQSPASGPSAGNVE